MDDVRESYARESSQKSNAVAPKRRRGIARVEKIVTAAGEIFTEVGYDGATMTAIAERAQTAIGSLYRFFPNKEILATEVLERFVSAQIEALDALSAREDTRDATVLADLLLDDAVDRVAWRQAAASLIDARDDAQDFRAALQSRVSARLAMLLQRAEPLDQVVASHRSVLVLHLMKLAQPFSSRADSKGVIAELRRAMHRVMVAD